MKNTTLILLLFVFNVYTLKAQTAFRGFEGSPKDNWDFSVNIPFYNMNSETDLWTDYSQANGRIPGPFAGSSYLAARDLDNPHSESEAQNPSPEHILTFDAFHLNGLGAELTFRLYYVFLDKNDYIYYELAYDNGTSWASPDERIDVFATTQGGKFSISSWDEVRFDVPAGVDYVRFRLVLYQNGNGYIGLDNFELKPNTLSNKNNTIEGFTFAPNPVNNVLRLKANVTLDKATVYDISGKELFYQKGNSNQMKLNISQLSSGIYLTKVESNGLSQTIKVVKN